MALTVPFVHWLSLITFLCVSIMSEPKFTLIMAF